MSHWLAGGAIVGHSRLPGGDSMGRELVQVDRDRLLIERPYFFSCQICAIYLMMETISTLDHHSGIR